MLHFTMDMPLYLMMFYGSVMILVIFMLRLLLKNRLPKFVFPFLWGLALLRLLVPFSLSSPLSMQSPVGEGRGVTSVAEADAVSLREGGENDPQIQTVVFGPEEIHVSAIYRRDLLKILYLAGALAAAAVLCSRKYVCSRRLRDRLLMEHNETVNDILREMDMGHILVFTSDVTASPLACGTFAPYICLPARMDFGNTMLLRYILTHEIMHIKRRDNWLKAVMAAALCLNWFNPLVWFMAKCLSADLETACDEAVLKKCGQEERKGYASSLLSMAITCRRATLLYSAFSKIEVEKRIRDILHYKKASLFCLLFTALFLGCSTVAFATSFQAPFSSDLSSYCASGGCRWGVRASITRDIALGREPDRRADNVILKALSADETGDRELLEVQIKQALAEEFGVEETAFLLEFSLCMAEEEIEKEYEAAGLVRGEDGFLLYQGESVRTYQDKQLGRYQSKEEGTVDIIVEWDKCGLISSVTVYRQGDSEYDRRSEEIERDRLRRGAEIISSMGISENIAVQEAAD